VCILGAVLSQKKKKSALHYNNQDWWIYYSRLVIKQMEVCKLQET